jgi:hypothetical protein
MIEARQVDELVTRLDAARDAFLAALENVEPELLTAPGLIGEWSARDLIIHMAYWSQHGADALALATAGRGDEFDYDRSQTDAMNVRVAREAQGIPVARAMEREAGAFAELRRRTAALDPALLGLRLGNGDSVEAVIGYDGFEHYAEHTRDVRAWWAEAEEGIDEVDEIEMSEPGGEEG